MQRVSYAAHATFRSTTWMRTNAEGGLYTVIPKLFLYSPGGIYVASDSSDHRREDKGM